MFKRLSTAVYLRAVHRDLSRIATALDAQTALLHRLADRFAPVDPPTERAEVRADTGVTYADPIDIELAERFAARTARDTGHVPDEEEILTYLNDEKTVDLHRRLIERDEELARLAESRR